MQSFQKIRNIKIYAVVAIFAASLFFVAVGCDRQSKESAAESKTATEVAGNKDSLNTPEHAPPGAKPGSYEDWCGGHQVPESLCTRCNASLIPAFKASGDWCGEHGLPESQCLICNPDLKIERPPRANENSR